MKLFTQRSITERALASLARERQKHMRHAERLERIASDASERARQHRDTCAAMSEALDALGISQSMATAAHEALAQDIAADIERARKAVQIDTEPCESKFTGWLKGFADPADRRFAEDYRKHGMPV